MNSWKFQFNTLHKLGEITLQSKVRLKAPEFGVKSKFIWFLELYTSGGTNSRKVIV